ncbi:hypothetical protein Glove_27g73 [Diversispora epigaea]|uniref:Uncharacterized protein n=1 Tax=Diversispora epigaea TaxID=1348612 RepID=A0A397JS17_9GLOM|nr:hypothetical protein Glove_27g73 [Diversispora epigaea]
MIESACPQLNGFFNYLVNTIIPKERSVYNKNEAKKLIVGLCYLIAGLRNKFVNQHKLEVCLYLMASGATWEAIDTISSLGYSACAKTIEEYQKKIQKEHIINIENYFIKNTITIQFMKTVDQIQFQHQLQNILSPVLQNPLPIYLIYQYIGVFDRSYSECKTQWISEHLPSINQFDRIELLTIHNYNDNIKERKIERSMKDLQLLGFNEQNLHSMQNYLNALKIIIFINNKTQHLNGQIAPVVADWPGQIFIRKALYTQLPLKFQPFYLQIKSFIPIMGPLHLSLNSREQVVLVHHSFFEKLFHFVFGQNKKLAKKLRPWRINLLLELSIYIEYQITIDLLENLIPSTLDIYAILFRAANTLANATAENIIKQAYVITNHNPMFKDTYCKTRHYPYNIPMLNFLSNKTSIFLLQYFRDLYYNIGKSKPKLNKRTKYPKTYILTTLGEEVDLRRLPTGYSTSFLPQNGLCDCCKLPINETNGTTFLKRIEKGSDVFTQEDLDNENNTEEEEEQYDSVKEIQDISHKLEIEINNIKNW